MGDLGDDEVFDEEALLSAVVAKWGPFGAHADLTRWMIAEIGHLRAELETARQERDYWQREAAR